MQKRNILIILAIILLIALAVFLTFIDYRDLRRSGVFGSASPRHLRPLRNPINPESIKSWMTVAYINEAFGLPGDYLKNELKISDKNYPNITLHKVAQDAGESDNIFLETLKNAIKQWKH